MRPTHSNMMFPGIGVGGYCLTKDPLIASWASQEFFRSVKLETSENAVRINDQMPDDAFNYFKNKIIKRCKSLNKIALLGVAYGPGIGDTRFSPVQKFYKKIKKLCANITCFDPYVNFWEEVSIEVESDLKNLRNNQYDCIIITTKHVEFEDNEIIIELIKKGVIVFDTIGVFAEIKDLHKFKNYFLLGSGINEK
jgi:UDP-N-acetyl-D-mannosaminuronate dehydrogenase